MLQSMRARLATDRQREEGFTLIELMVVVLIIAILLAIAIPTFLGAQNKAKDRSAQSSARNTVTAAKTIAADAQDYTTTNPTTLAAVEPSIAYVANATASTGPKQVSVLGDSTGFYAAVLSKTNTCFYIKDTVTNGTQFNTGPSTSCTADAAKAAATGWQAQW